MAAPAPAPSPPPADGVAPLRGRPSPAPAPHPGVLTPAERPRAPLPRWTLWCFGAALVLGAPADWIGGNVLDGLATLGAAAAVVAALVLGAWLEARLFRAGEHRRWIHFAWVLVPLVGAVLGAATVVLTGLLLSVVGISNHLASALVVATLWFTSAAVGSGVVLVVDLAVSAFVRSFRRRIVAAVLALMAAGLTVVAGASALLVAFVDTALRGGGDDLGHISIDLNSEQLTMTIAEAARQHPLWVALGFFGVGVALFLPAAVSVAGKLAETVTLRIEPLKLAFDGVAAGRRDLRVEEGGAADFVDLARRFNHMLEDLELSERMERAFGVYVSTQVMERIRAQHGEAAIPASLREASVLFADIRGFTAMSERVPPEAVLAVLNRYFEEVVEVVERHQGYLNKFIGDAVMVVFNGPVDQPDHAERAVRCGLDLQATVARLNAEGAFPEVGRMEVGVGVASGPMVSGNVGGARQMEYTVLGDTVNLASRLTGKAKAGEVWVSAASAGALPKDLCARALPPMEVKGKAAPVVPYVVTGPSASPAEDPVTPVSAPAS